MVNWVYALLGRLLYEVGAKDKWQVIPFIVGRAGTGKSLLLKSVAFFFNPEDVETVANNCQKDFGLETLVSKLIWMCYEVKHDFKMDQAALQCMASGDGMSIMRKNKTAVSLVWTVPGILAGNEIANWVDNSGSMSRRVVMIQFQRKVKEVDGHLDSKIRNNIGAFLHKCASAYASKCEEFGGKDLWQDHLGEPILPKYFHGRREKFQIDTDHLSHFLKDSSAIRLTSAKKVSISPLTLFRECFLTNFFFTLTFLQGMPFKRLKEIASNYFQSELGASAKFQWKESKYASIFADRDIRRVKLDATIIRECGGGKTIRYSDGEDYGIGTDWLLGIEESGAATAGEEFD